MSTRNHNTGDYVHSLSTNSQLNIIQRYKLLTNIHTYKTLITPYEQKPESYSYSSTRSLHLSTLWHEGTKCCAPLDRRRLSNYLRSRESRARAITIMSSRFRESIVRFYRGKFLWNRAAPRPRGTSER